MITYWTCSGPIPARLRAPAMATPPSSVADLLVKEPRRRPTGVRAPPMMTGWRGSLMLATILAGPWPAARQNFSNQGNKDLTEVLG
jgi:hypothetical protein